MGPLITQCGWPANAALTWLPMPPAGACSGRRCAVAHCLGRRSRPPEPAVMVVRRCAMCCVLPLCMTPVKAGMHC